MFKINLLTRLKQFKLNIDELFFIVGILLILISQFVLYYKAPYTKIYDRGIGWEQLGNGTPITIILQYAGFVLILIASLLNIEKFLINKKTLFVFFLVFIICVVSVAHSIYGILNVGITSAFYNTSFPIIFLFFMVVVIPSNKRIFNIFLKINYFITFYSLIMAFLYFLEFKKGHPDGIIGNSAFLKFYIQGFVSALVTCYNLKNKFISVIIIFICIIFGFLGTTRSFIIQSILLLIIYIIINSKKKILAICLTIALCVIFSLAAIYILQEYFSSSYEFFMKKLFNDSRSSQYVQLFNQISYTDLIFGNGFLFQYMWNGKLYSYIDNVYLLIMMRYGVLLLIPLVLLLLISFFNPLIHRKSECKKYSLMILHIIMAFGGLSVYFMFEIDIKMLIIYMIIGHSIIGGKE